jgi:hypothetical protein
MPLLKPLRAKAGEDIVTITTLQDAGSYIQKHGKAHTLHWELAASAVDAADKNSKLVEHATKAIENALKTDGLLL